LPGVKEGPVRRWWQDIRKLAESIEAPTCLLACIIYGGWLALTLSWHALPVWAVVPLGAWLCAWHMSLQHELIHGHPTRCAAVNHALAAPPLNLWLPFALYREQHLRHHRDSHLTDPLEDPESTYMSPEAWAASSPLRRWVQCACNSLAGRVLLGPAFAIAGFWVRQARLLPGKAPLGVWLGHAAGVCLVLGWVCGVCHIDAWAYAACFVYPGTALTLVRSLAEHRAADRPEDRTAVVEKAGLLGLLFLNNNLHVLHHERPGVPWYALPSEWRRSRASLLEGRRGPLYRGYREVAARYAWRPQHPGPHPATRSST
jgi:fatty acid desaturase